MIDSTKNIILGSDIILDRYGILLQKLFGPTARKKMVTESFFIIFVLNINEQESVSSIFYQEEIHNISKIQLYSTSW